MFTKSMKSSLVIAGLLTGALYGFVSPAAATTGDVCVMTGKTVYLTAKQGAVPVIRVAPNCSREPKCILEDE